MKERPITFTQDMVKAQRAGRKNVTRRMNGLEAINENPDGWRFLWLADERDKAGRVVAVFEAANTGLDSGIYSYPCPYGQPGDLLWVKETCYVDNNYMPYLNRETTVVLYQADREEWSSYEQALEAADHMQQINARFMYKELARTRLEVVSIVPERLLDITEESAKAEGVLWYWSGEEGKFQRFKDYLASAKGYGHPDFDYPTVGTARESFLTLFKRINKKAPANPWVWVVTFKEVNHAGAKS